jgi:hypothetical protein
MNRGVRTLPFRCTDSPLLQGMVEGWFLPPARSRSIRVFGANGRYDTTAVNLASPPTSTSGWGEGLNGLGALNFDGSNDRLDVPAAFPGIQGDLTVLAAIKTTGTGQYVLSGFYNTASSNNGWGLGIGIASGTSTTGKLAFWSRGATQPGWIGSTSSNYHSGSWILAGVSLSGTTASFYKNGVPDGTGTTVVPGANTTAKTIGCVSNLGTFYSGSLGGMWIFDRALSRSVIEGWYAQWLRGFPDLLRQSARRVWADVPAGGGGFDAATFPHPEPVETERRPWKAVAY